MFWASMGPLSFETPFVADAFANLQSMPVREGSATMSMSSWASLFPEGADGLIKEYTLNHSRDPYVI